jgi:predicted deacetylase
MARRSMRTFNVTIHDVTPVFDAQLRAIVDAFAPVVGTRLAVAAVPRWHGRRPAPVDRAFWRWVLASSSETLLHGYEHVQPRFSGINGVCKGNELRGLPPAVVRERLQKGQRELTELLGAPAVGFLAPAYERGAASDDVLAACDLSYYLGWKRLVGLPGPTVRLATWVWDVAPVRGAGYVGEWLGWLMRVRRGAVPAIALHPKDVDNGYLDRAVRVARRLVARGFRAVVPSELLARPAAGADGRTIR